MGIPFQSYDTNELLMEIKKKCSVSKNANGGMALPAWVQDGCEPSRVGRNSRKSTSGSGSGSGSGNTDDIAAKLLVQIRHGNNEIGAKKVKRSKSKKAKGSGISDHLRSLVSNLLCPVPHSRASCTEVLDQIQELQQLVQQQQDQEESKKNNNDGESDDDDAGKRRGLSKAQSTKQILDDSISEHKIDMEVVNQACRKQFKGTVKPGEVCSFLTNGTLNDATATYHLLCAKKRRIEGGR